jgi:multiple sugar transport system ATP-binding protein
MADVNLENVCKTYAADIHAVRSFNLSIEKGEFLVLVGPSGCGKSTLLRMIAGLESISSGKITIGERVVNDVPPKDRNIAMVFQSYALYPHMTVFDNMAFALKLRHFPKTEIKARVKEAAEILGISELLLRRPKELSGGQRQRVAVGRAIVRKPIAFLFDEPLSNLDAMMRVQMRMEINKLHHKLKTTMIYVTHDQTEAMTLGDRIVVMNKGVIQQCDTPQKLYRMPANKFVGSFIGSPPMNFINGMIQKAGQDFVFVNGGFKVYMPAEWANTVKHYAGKKVLFGIRPEDIYDKLFVSDHNPRNVIQAMCDVVEPLGSETFLHMRIGESLFTAKVPGQVQVEANADMDLVLDVSRGHLFDAVTEKTII